MVRKIILASKSKVRKEILDKNGLNCEVQPSNVDEDTVKESLEKQKATPEEVSKIKESHTGTFLKKILSN